MIWRSLLVDDEPPARRRLRRLLEPYPNIKVVGAVGSMDAAVEILETESVDLIFLDIQMPRASGFALWERIDVHAQVVFVTAHNEHAVRAFERGALDYVLKPVDPIRLANTLGRLPPHRGAQDADDRIICLNLGSNFRIVRMREIICILAQGDYTFVHLRDGSRELVASSLASWIARLPTDVFARVHRSAVVRLDLVNSFAPKGSAWLARIAQLDQPIEVSRRYFRKIRGRFSPA